MAAPLERPALLHPVPRAGLAPDHLNVDATNLLASRYVSAAFWEAVAARDLTHFGERERTGCDDPAAALAGLGALVCRSTNRHTTTSFVDGGTVLWLVFIDQVDGQWRATVAGGSPRSVDTAIERLCALVPDAPPQDASLVAIRFWSLGSCGPDWFRRSLPALPWELLTGNYPAGVREQLEELIGLERPQGQGKLVLLHGPPGTGKTTFIRTLARTWTDWAEPAYVVDPEAFFSVPSYLLAVLTDQFSDDADEADREPRWKLLIIEDADELLLADAKARSGQALSRLLNLTDGLIGEGLRVVILITTNVDCVSLHPALRRPGRCLANIAVDAFSPAEAAAWLRARGVDVAPGGDRPVTVAELHEALAPRQVVREAAARPIPGYL